MPQSLSDTKARRFQAKSQAVPQSFFQRTARMSWSSPRAVNTWRLKYFFSGKGKTAGLGRVPRRSSRSATMAATGFSPLVTILRRRRSKRF